MKSRLLSYSVFSLVFLMILFRQGTSLGSTVGSERAGGSGCSYYVSIKGSNSNEGSLERPFRTIQRGCDVLTAGDTLYIMEGEYNEKITLKASGADGAYITIRSYGEGRTAIDGSGITGNGAVIYIKDKSFISIKGLEIKNSSSGDIPSGILYEGSGKGIEILGNRIHSIRSNRDAHGIAVYGTNGKVPVRDVTISGNEVYDCRLGSSEAVVVNGNVEGFAITKNVVHDNDNIGIDCIGFEGTADSNDQARSGLVSENRVYNISSVLNPAYDGDACAGGIYVDGGRDIVIERNTIYNCDIGIEVAAEHYGKAAANILAENNLIRCCGLYGLAFGGASQVNGYSEDCIFRLNTLYNNQVGVCVQKSRNNRVESNIIYGTETLLEGDTGSNSFSYNLWYSPYGNNEELSPFADPCFIAPQRLDFRLRKGSPAIDKGSPEFSEEDCKTDILNRHRVINGRVDCGAYEYQGE